jgi:hypothetical protein
MYKRIQLSKGVYTLVDAEFAYLNEYRWYCCQEGYAKRNIYFNGTHKSERMHRMILNIIDKDIHVDHINGNTLDNRKINLRMCTPLENARNQKKPVNGTTSVFKGVSKHSTNNTYIAQITVEGTKVYLGSFSTEQEAKDVYDKANSFYFKDFARHNSSKFNIIEDWNQYEVLPRASKIRNHIPRKVGCSNGTIFASIEEAAIILKVKQNTIVCGCTKNKKVKGVHLWYA